MPIKDLEARRAHDRIRHKDPEVRRRRNERVAAWKKANPEAVKAQRRRYMLGWRYGLTEEAHAHMLDEQGGKCANQFCLRPAECIDHNHTTGEVRGLLCKQCNLAIGLLNDDARMTEGISQYLKRFSNNVN